MKKKFQTLSNNPSHTSANYTIIIIQNGNCSQVQHIGNKKIMYSGAVFHLWNFHTLKYTLSCNQNAFFPIIVLF